APPRTGVTPDLVCLGKIVGGGLPVGAYGGSRALMSGGAPLGPAYQAGTLSGNPLAMAAGIATLDLLDDAAYARLEVAGAALALGLTRAATRAGVGARVQRVGSLLTLFFTERAVRNEDDARSSDLVRFAAFHRAMLRRGMLLPPSQFECLFLSLAHTDADIDAIVAAAASSFEEIR
ncbi:MAG TPA: aminotransferase class III-fold pyridoxal phosphate-dependent enzyme, partial [Candidatus Acidoferrales bacterium]|nr:aminotransferase class III-fold pyridoxal phosphate-dependent enzyme [Candidatus Acidoferrales bacterium]